MEPSMKRTALSLLVLCAASAHAANVVIPGAKAPPPEPPALSAAPTAQPAQAVAAAPAKAVAAPAAKAAPAPGIATNEVESLVKSAAMLEKSDGCEAAYVKYQEAGGKLIQM